MQVSVSTSTATYTRYPTADVLFHHLLLDEPTRDFTLDAYATSTSITDLTPDLDYSVSISSYYGSEESLPIFGQLTSKYPFHRTLAVILDSVEKSAQSFVKIKKCKYK